MSDIRRVSVAVCAWVRKGDSIGWKERRHVETSSLTWLGSEVMPRQTRRAPDKALKSSVCSIKRLVTCPSCSCASRKTSLIYKITIDLPWTAHTLRPRDISTAARIASSNTPGRHWPPLIVCRYERNTPTTVGFPEHSKGRVSSRKWTEQTA